MKAPKTNEQNDFLIRCLTVANDMLSLEKVFELNEYNKTYSFDQSHLDDVGTRIAENLNGRYNNSQLYVNNEVGSYVINLSMAEQTKGLLKDLKAIISKTFRVGNITGKFSNDTETNPKNWQSLAENQFNSADEILECNDYIIACENLDQAQTKLEEYKNMDPILVPPKAIADLTKLVAQWQPFVNAWHEIYKIGLKTDYVRLAKIKKERAIDELANNNVAIKQLIEGNYFLLRYVSPRQIFDLFKSFDVEPVNNFDLYFSLETAEIIKTTKKSGGAIWNEDHTNVIGQNPDKLKYKDFDAYLLQLQMDAKNEKCKFQETYFKVNGQQKKMSHKAWNRMRSDEQSNNERNKLIDNLIKNEQTIKKYI